MPIEVYFLQHGIAKEAGHEPPVQYVITFVLYPIYEVEITGQ
jgi:hypothetical protein